MFIEIIKIQKDGTRTCHVKQWPTPPSLPVASYGANRSRITYPSPFDEHHDNTFELIIIWPPSQTLKVLLHPVPNTYVSLRFHRFCCILYSAAVSVVLAP